MLIILNRTSVLCIEEIIAGHVGGMTNLPQVLIWSQAQAQVQGRNSVQLWLHSTM